MTPIKHENVTKMAEYFEDGVRAFIVMKFAPGGDLSRAPYFQMSEARVADIFKQEANAL